MIADDPFRRQAIERYFDESCRTFGHSHHAVGWYTAQTQEIRFINLALIGDLDQHSVLDVGCGVVQLLEFFVQHRIEARYTGIDFSSAMIESAKAHYPSGHFEQADLLEYPEDVTFDYVLASGAFNYKVPDQSLYLSTMIQKMMRLSKKGVALNVLSSLTPADQKDESFFYYCDPAELMRLCLTFSSKVDIKTSYLPNDCTVYLYK